MKRDIISLNEHIQSNLEQNSSYKNLNTLDEQFRDS